MRNKSEKKTLKKAIIIGIVMIITCIIGGVFYLYNMLGKIDKVRINKENLGINESYKEHGITNIALFGIDAPKGSRGRSDSIMILTLDRDKNVVKLTSILRDTRVKIQGHGMDKINHAYAFGGPELAIKTLNDNFGLNIENFFTVNFNSLIHIINELGGVNIDITDGDLKYINNYIRHINKETDSHSPDVTKAGKQKLDGVQAVAYCRIRYDGGDQKRTERHRVVLSSMMETIKSISPTKYPSIIVKLLPYVETSMTSSEIIMTATKSVNLLNSPIIEKRYPLDGNYEGKMINGVYYTVTNINEMKENMQSFIYNKLG